MKTKVTDYLSSLDISFELKPHKKPALTCETAAEQRGVSVSQIVKCMVAEDDKSALIAMLIPGDRTLKSSKARKKIGALQLTLVDPAKLAKDLGLTVGAISPVQLLDKARILMDPSVLEEKFVDISSGDPLCGIELLAEDLALLTNAEMVEMVSKNR